jgi:hypothetical protein
LGCCGQRSFSWPCFIALVVAGTALAAAHVSTADAAVQANCLTSTKLRPLNITPRRALDTDQIIRGLELTPDQKRALRARLAGYPPRPGRECTLGDLGLTPEQIAEIERRLAAYMAERNKYPLGWPCAPFKNKTKVIAFMRAQLIYNGFRPNMTFTVASPRRIHFNAIQDGISYFGVIVKTAPRQIQVALHSTSGGDGATFRLGFEA